MASEISVPSEIPPWLAGDELSASEQRAVWRRLRTLSRVVTTGNEPVRAAESIAPAPDTEDLEREVLRISNSRTLLRGGNCVVIAASAAEIPLTLLEIGRLRERSARAEGSETGRSLAVDRFDESATHLFVWHFARRAVLGGMRIGEVRSEFGQRDSRLYCANAFEFCTEAQKSLRGAHEISQVFVAAGESRSFRVWSLLWHGLGNWILRNPSRHQWVAVDVLPRSLRAPSLELILRRLEHVHGTIGEDGVHGRRRPRRFSHCEIPDALVEDETRFKYALATLEGRRYELPPLLRQSLVLGGRPLAFHVDRERSDSIAVLTHVDLCHAPIPELTRIFAPDAIEEFVRHHAIEELHTPPAPTRLRERRAPVPVRRRNSRSWWRWRQLVLGSGTA